MLAIIVAAATGLPFAYPYLETARLWYDVTGVDVSAHQGLIDWETLARSDVAFAYIKATEGGDFRDKLFRRNWDEAKKAGLRRGAYHFFTQCRSGAEQAQNFIATVPPDADALPAALDAEHMGPCANAAVADPVHEIEVFLAALEAHYGRRPIVYTTPKFHAAYLEGRLVREAFWVRSIFVPPWFRSKQWIIWQYHHLGRRPGVNGPVDLNAYRGTQKDFAAFTTNASRP